MYKRNRIWTYIVFGFIAIGILANVLRHPGAFLIPLFVFGGVFWLYKFPPNRWRWRHSKTGSRFSKGKRKTGSFRVIHGNKDSDSDEPPKYH